VISCQYPSIAILSCVSRSVGSRHDHCTICCTGRRNFPTVADTFAPVNGVSVCCSRRGRTARTLRRCPNRSLRDHDLVTAFEPGWRLLYEDVSLRACDRLIATLAEVRHLDAEIARDLDRLRRTLVRHGAPARASARRKRSKRSRSSTRRRGPHSAVCSANARCCARSCRRCSPAARAR
jgi:hypothetical protein